jgi:hypothetical protein
VLLSASASLAIRLFLQLETALVSPRWTDSAPRDSPVKLLTACNLRTRRLLMLKDETNFAVTRGVVCDVFLLVQHGSGIGRLQPSNDSEQSRFSRTRWTEQCKQIPVRYFETYVAKTD